MRAVAMEVPGVGKKGPGHQEPINSSKSPSRSPPLGRVVGCSGAALPVDGEAKRNVAVPRSSRHQRQVAFFHVFLSRGLSSAGSRSSHFKRTDPIRQGFYVFEVFSFGGRNVGVRLAPGKIRGYSCFSGRDPETLPGVGIKEESACPPSGKEEEALLESLRKGDPGAVDEPSRAVPGEDLQPAMSILKNETDRREAAAGVFMTVIRRWERSRGTPPSTRDLPDLREHLPHAPSRESGAE